MKKTHSNFSIPNKYILIGLSTICIGLIGITSINHEALAPVKDAVGYVLVPIQSGLNRAGTFLHDNTSKFQEMWSALEENEILRQQLESLTEENNRLTAEKYELARLRELYELDQTYLDYDKVGARVISKAGNGWFHIFRIDKGSGDGIEVDMNVLAGGGLVGIVTEVGPNYSIVRSIIDDNSNVGAMALSNSASCMVLGDLELYETGTLRLGFIDKDDEITDDERIVTSNTSEKFLPGLLIGYARNIQMDANNLTKSGELVPVVDFSHLHEVLVITKVKDTGSTEE